MPEISLLFTTGLPPIDHILLGSIGLLEALFPARVRAYYLVGSYADDGYTAASDIDLVPIFKDALQPGEEERYRQIVRSMDLLSPVRLGFGLRDEARSFRDGGVGIKIGSVLLYGEDVRDRIPLTPLEDYLRQSISTSLDLLRYQRGNPPRLAIPLAYPDPADPYFGYLKEQTFAGVARPSSAALFTHLMFLASTLATLKTGQYNASKTYSWRFYQAQVGDSWSPFLAETYLRLKQQWGYAIPPSPEEQAQLTALCRQTLAFENHFLNLAREFLLERISSPAEPTRAWATQEIQKLAG